VGNSTAVSSRPSDTPAEAGSPSGSATVDPGFAQAVASDATTAAAVVTSTIEAGFAVANNLAGNTVTNTANNTAINGAPSNASSLTASNLGASNLTLNSNGAAAPTPISLAASASDAASNAKPGFPAQPDPGAVSTTAADKKSSGAIQPNATAASATTAQTVPGAPASGTEASVTLTASAPPAAAPSPQAGSDSAPALPQPHQMLDSAPPAAPPAPDSAAAAQMNTQTSAQANAQMHVGIRTDAFGSVEIHTVVQQSQIGITVQSDRDIARWFSSEVPSLESGLNHNHLNLTTVNFDNRGSGIQTATSFQQGQPRQPFSETPGSSSAARPNTLSEEDTALESATVDMLPADLSVGPALTRVSIHA
jgi:hypothetical protein